MTPCEAVAKFGPDRVSPGTLARCPDWQQQSRGLGDAIARVTASLGVKSCKGCRKRQGWLNWLFPARGRSGRAGR
jgi:hypothetical protein